MALDRAPLVVENLITSFDYFDLIAFARLRGDQVNKKLMEVIRAQGDDDSDTNLAIRRKLQSIAEKYQKIAPSTLRYTKEITQDELSELKKQILSIEAETVKIYLTEANQTLLGQALTEIGELRPFRKNGLSMVSQCNQVINSLPDSDKDKATWNRLKNEITNEFLRPTHSTEELNKVKDNYYYQFDLARLKFQIKEALNYLQDRINKDNTNKTAWEKIHKDFDDFSKKLPEETTITDLSGAHNAFEQHRTNLIESIAKLKAPLFISILDKPVPGRQVSEMTKNELESHILLREGRIEEVLKSLEEEEESYEHWEKLLTNYKEVREDFTSSLLKSGSTPPRPLEDAKKTVIELDKEFRARDYALNMLTGIEATKDKPGMTEEDKTILRKAKEGFEQILDNKFEESTPQKITDINTAFVPVAKKLGIINVPLEAAPPPPSPARDELEDDPDLEIPALRDPVELVGNAVDPIKEKIEKEIYGVIAEELLHWSQIQGEKSKAMEIARLCNDYINELDSYKLTMERRHAACPTEVTTWSNMLKTARNNLNLMLNNQAQDTPYFGERYTPPDGNFTLKGALEYFTGKLGITGNRAGGLATLDRKLAGIADTETLVFGRKFTTGSIAPKETVAVTVLKRDGDNLRLSLFFPDKLRSIGSMSDEASVYVTAIDMVETIHSKSSKPILIKGDMEDKLAKAIATYCAHMNYKCFDQRGKKNLAIPTELDVQQFQTNLDTKYKDRIKQEFPQDYNRIMYGSNYLTQFKTIDRLPEIQILRGMDEDLPPVGDAPLAEEARPGEPHEGDRELDETDDESLDGDEDIDRELEGLKPLDTEEDLDRIARIKTLR